MRNRVQKDLDDELASGVAAEAFENLAIEVGPSGFTLVIESTRTCMYVPAKYTYTYTTLM